MDSIRKGVRYLLYAACTCAFILLVFWLFDFLIRLFSDKVYTGIPYTKFQITLLTDLAKTLIPTVSGTIALTGAGVAYLQKSRMLSVKTFQMGIFLIFVFAIISLACWVSVQAAATDAAGVFKETGLVTGLNESQYRFYNLAYLGAVRSAQIGASLFFLVFGMVAIIGIKFFELTPIDGSPESPNQAPPPEQLTAAAFSIFRRWP